VVKKRPRVWWFAVGGVLLVAAVVVFAISIAQFIHSVSHTDARFPGQGEHAVSLPAHVQRGLYVAEDLPPAQCTAKDASGAPVSFQSPDGTFTYDGWVAKATFDTGDGHLTFTCDGPAGTEVRVAAVPSNHDFIRLGLLGIGLPLLLGGVGFVILLVTTILWFTRRPAPRSGAPPGRSPGTPAGPPPGSPPSA